MNTDVLFLIVTIIMWGIFVHRLSRNKGEGACDGSECDKCPFPRCEKR